MLVTQTPRGRPAALILAATLLAGACSSSDKVTGTNPPPNNNATPCVDANTVQLSPLQGVRVDCSNGTTVTLAGSGASYLIVPNFASGEPLPDRPTSYSISASGASTASVLPVADAAAAVASVTRAWARLAAGPAPGALQRAFDATLRGLAARRVSAGGWSGARAAAARASVAAATPPPVGSLRAFHVISTLDTLTIKFKRVTARLQFVGNNILVYEDTLAPANGFTATQFAEFSQTFDQVLYPIDVNTFGPPSDIDQNGRLVMLLTPVVNGLTPASQCASQGFIAGFFSGGDLASTDTTSNQGEVFYTLAPDPNGTVSCAHPAAGLEETLGSTFLHEFQHLINFSQHVLVHNSNPEEGWLDEGLSLVAEELGSLYYEQKYPPPAGRTNPSQIFPDSAEPYIGDLLLTSYDYTTGPDTTTLTLHSDDQTGLNWRGGDWLLVHYLGDQNGGAPFFKALVQSARTGIPNIEAAAGQPFTTLFNGFSTALYADSLPGVPRSQIPAADRFTTRNLRQLFARLAVTGSVSNPFPLPVRTLGTTAQNGSLVPGAMAFYHLTTSAATVTVTFSAPGGATLPLAVHPQLSIFRLPPGL